MLARSSKSLALVILGLIMASNFVSATVMAEHTSAPSTTFQKPSFSFDFSSLSDRTNAENQMTDLRNNWGDFFTSRSKPVFSDTLTNVVKGSGN